MFLQLLLLFLPWKIRRIFLIRIFKYNIARDARIGFSLIQSKRLIMRSGSKIGHLNICKPIDLLELDENASIGNRNFITGFSVNSPEVIKFKHFGHIKNRKCELKVGKETGITSRHYFDCNGGIYIGNYCEIAGFETAFITHSIDLEKNRQDAAAITVGDYCFISTRVTLLKGSSIPPYSIVGACSLVNKPLQTPYSLYGGIPCKHIKSVESYNFFNRKSGFVV